MLTVILPVCPIPRASLTLCASSPFTPPPHLAAALATVSRAEDVGSPIRDTSTVVGGKRPADVNEEGVLAAATAAVKHIDTASNSVYSTALLRVVSATKQVVAGLKYSLVLEAAPTTCTKRSIAEDDPSRGECSPDPSRATRYTVSVLSQPWRKPPYTVDIVASEAVQQREEGGSAE